MRRQDDFWDKAARKYAASPIRNEAAYQRTLEATAAHLTPQDRVLEIGCGTGTTALRLAGHAGRYLGTDISGEMIAIARERAAAAGVETVDFQKTAASEAGRAELAAGAPPFDAVLAFNLLHLLEDLPGTLAALREKLKPGGLLISKTVCLKNWGWYIRPLVTAMQLVGKAPHVGFLSIAELDRTIVDAGFRIVEADLLPASHKARFVVAQKI
ncbi:bifunctional 2-polyprenyl-6-hydroxyphenol methylase/3-demethylubiquinol 3-O-methyltransferase UbiG [Stappia sp. TSB10P1A]|uniref:class I SAM-dependent methyltransferase n=1 Tax=Stappia sp. TSB10P1A TaxID=2003585 RepID=UPI001643F52A|nr:class I SAM-dependent methyltransferase [Stappia sp. TSB10P1A]